LDARREVGATFKSPQAVKLIVSAFEKDWLDAEKAETEGASETPPAAKVAKKVAKAVSKTLAPVGPTLEIAVREVVGRAIEIPLDSEELEGTVREAVVQAVKEVVRDAVQDIVEKDDSVLAP
jgi:hypothetical protein